MLKIFITLLLSIIANSLIAQSPVPALKDKLWGYVDQNQNWIIQPQYDEALPFTEGMSIVRKGEKKDISMKKEK